MPPSMRRAPAIVTGTKGVLFVHEVVNECGSLFQKIAAEEDLGLDAYVEFCADGKPSGEVIAVQIKAGPSFRTRSGYRIPASREHLARWSRFTIPVAGIVVDTETNKAYWTNISRYISDNPSILECGPWRIPINATNEFSKESFGGSFHDSFTFAIPETVAYYAELLLSEHIDDRWDGYVGLMSREHLMNRLTPLVLAVACSDSDEMLRGHVADGLSRYLPHPESGFVPKDEKIRAWARQVIAKTLTRETVRLLVQATDDFGVDRGTLGQSFAVLFHEVPNIGEYLVEIALDEQGNRRERFWSIIYIGYLGLVEMLSTLIRNAVKLCNATVWEAAEWCIEALAEEAESKGYLKVGWRDQLRDLLSIDWFRQPALFVSGYEKTW